MEEVTEGYFVSALKRGREELNARFVYARRTTRSLDPSAFFEVLQNTIGPIIEKAGKELSGDPKKIDEVLNGLYDVALELSGQGYLGQGSRCPLVRQVWQRLLPAVLPFLVQAPEKIAASFSNAAFHFDLTFDTEGDKWIELTTELSSRCKTVDELLNLGLVLAWRCGMAHYRDSALALWQKLPAPLMARSLGFINDGETAPEKKSMVEAMTYPWFQPFNKTDKKAKRGLVIVAEVSGFRGFGGHFIKPPKVGVAGDQIYAWDDDACWTIHADCFGACLQRFGTAPPRSVGLSAGSVMIGKRGEVSFNGHKARLDELAAATGHATDGKTLAVTLRSSHKIFLVAPVAAGSK